GPVPLPGTAVQAVAADPPRGGATAARTGPGAGRATVARVRAPGHPTGVGVRTGCPARPGDTMTTRYLGLHLRRPVIATPRPPSQTVDGVRALADTGLGAVVMYSLFEEEIRRDEEHAVSLLEAYVDRHPESLSYFPDLARTADAGMTATYLRLLESC